MRIHGLRALGACLLLGVMAACGGGGSGGGGRPPGDPGDGPMRRPAGPGTISGVAHDGPITGATINVYEWEGQRGRLIISTTTDSMGSYSLTLGGPKRPVLIEAVGGSYVEEASESTVIIQSGQALFAVQNYDPGQALTSNLTYYSTLATGLAENLVKLGSPADAAVTTANARIADILGLDLSRAPAVVNNPQGLADGTAVSAEFGFATAAVSTLTQSMSIANDSRPNAVINSIGFIQAAYDDIRTDGVLDGRGSNGPIALGKISLTTDTYRRQLALNILRAAASGTVNRLQVNPAQLIAVASRLNSSSDPIFANAPVTPFDTDRPNIVDLSIGDGEILFGARRKINFSIQSLAALTNVQLLLNDAVAVDMADPNAMTTNLDTTRFPDGQFDFTLVATDAAGAVVRRTFKVTLNNLSAVMVSNTLKTDQFYNGVFDALFSISDPVGIRTVEYLVDGVVQQTQATTGDPFRFDTRRFADGPHTVTAQVTNVQGEVRGMPISINIDNTPPEVTFSLADNTLTNQNNLSLTISAADAVFNAPKLPNVANPAEFLLDGKNNQFLPVNISVGGSSVSFSQPLQASVTDEDLGTVTKSLPDGLHTFSFRVSDVLNSTVVTRRFTLDRSPPVVSVTSPTNCVLTEAGDQCQSFSGVVTFRGTIVDSVSAVNPAITLTLTGRDDDTGTFTAPLPGVPSVGLTLQSDSSFSVTVDTRTLPVVPNGLVGYVITSMDAAGNVTGRFGSTGVFRVLN